MEISEKYNIIDYLAEVWLQSLQNSFDTEVFQQMLDISMNSADKNPRFFEVIFIKNSEVLNLL